MGVAKPDQKLNPIGVFVLISSYNALLIFMEIDEYCINYSEKLYY